MNETIMTTADSALPYKESGIICTLLLISLLVLIVPILCFFGKRLLNRMRSVRNKPVNGVLCLTFLLLLSVWSLRYAVGYFTMLREGANADLAWYEEIFNSIMHALQTVSMDEDYTDYIVNGKDMIRTLFSQDSWLVTGYGVYASVLNFLAPVLGGAFIFDVLISFFPVVRLRLLELVPWKKKYYFSELNERSLSLARSLTDKKQAEKGERWHRPVIVFTDAYPDDTSESSTELMSAARMIGAICVRQDLLHLVKRGGKMKEYLLIDEKELQNIRTLADLASPAHCRKLRRVTVRIFYQDDAYLLTERKIFDRIREQCTGMGFRWKPYLRLMRRKICLHDIEQQLGKQAELAYRRKQRIYAEPPAKRKQSAETQSSDLYADAAAALPQSVEEALCCMLNADTARKTAKRWEHSRRIRLPLAARLEVLLGNAETICKNGFSFAPRRNEPVSPAYARFETVFREKWKKAEKLRAADLLELRDAAHLAEKWDPLTQPLYEILERECFDKNGAPVDPTAPGQRVQEMLTDRILPAVERIRNYQHMVYDLLQDLPLFRPLLGEAQEGIHAAVIGLGNIGTEMLLSSYWCGIMLDTPFSLNAVSAEDADTVRNMLKRAAPELADSVTAQSELLRIYEDADAPCNPPYCTLRYAQADMETEPMTEVQFRPLFAENGDSDAFSLLDCNYFFISAGSDVRNIGIAEQISREVAVRKKAGLHPGRVVIAYVVYDSALCAVLNRRFSSPDGAESELFPGIEMTAVGDLESLFSRRNMLMQQTSSRAFRIGQTYRERSHEERVQAGKARARSAYNYYSSTARAVHQTYKLYSVLRWCGDPKHLQGLSDADRQRIQARCDIIEAYLQTGQAPEQAFDAYRSLYTPEQSDSMQMRDFCDLLYRTLGALEHRRWNAYMRAVGFRRSDSQTKEINLKLHNMLVETVMPYAPDTDTERRTDRLDDVCAALFLNSKRSPENFTDYKEYDYPNDGDLQ